MKQETKELLYYIIHKFDGRRIIGDFLTEKEKVDARRFNEQQDKIQAFLRSIPEIEKHLTEGGYIQDRNGTPICHGDKIKVYAPEKDLPCTCEHAVLNWNPRLARFEVFSEDIDGSFLAVSLFTPQMLEKEN